jgi:hypothetical protein
MCWVSQLLRILGGLVVCGLRGVAFVFAVFSRVSSRVPAPGHEPLKRRRRMYKVTYLPMDAESPDDQLGIVSYYS